MAPRKGMKIGALGLDPLAAQLDHVADLVEQQEEDEADREGEAEEPAVGDDRDRHRAEGGEQLEVAEQQQERFRLHRERGQRRQQPAERACAAACRPEPGWIGPSGRARPAAHR